MSDHSIHLQEDGPCEGGRGQDQVAVDRLPDNVLLEIFDFYRKDPAVHICEDLFPPPWRWTTLTQVCRRWQHVIFGSPRRLGLQVVCTKTTPTRTSLDIWPPFPIVILCSCLVTGDEKGIENLIAAVERRDRVSHIHVDAIYSPALEKLTAAMQEPFPFLTYLRLSSFDQVEALPETFLGGSAPLLESFVLLRIPFPTFPKFIMSATHIAYLILGKISDSGSISPEVMTACLAALPNLKSLTLTIGCQFSLSRPLPTSLLSPTRVVLPALTDLCLSYFGECSESIVGRIDTPLLNKLTIIFSMDVVIGDMPQIHNFIGRTQGLKPFSQAGIQLDYQQTSMVLGYLESPTMFELELIYQTQYLQLSPMTQISGQRSPLLSHVEEFQMVLGYNYLVDSVAWTRFSDPSSWLQHFHLFVALRSLYVSEQLVKIIESALQELVGGRTMEVLPALRELLLEGLQPSKPTPKGIELFAAARELSGYPITIWNWVTNEDEDLE